MGCNACQWDAINPSMGYFFGTSHDVCWFKGLKSTSTMDIYKIRRLAQLEVNVRILGLLPVYVS